MIIKFDPYFFKYTSFQETIEVKGDSLRAVLESLLNDYPQLHVFLVADNGKEADKTSFKLNGEYITDVKEIHRKVSSGDVLEVGCDVPYGENGAGKIIAGVIIAVVGAVYQQPYLVGFGISLALGGVGELVAGQPSLPTFDSGTNTSSTYTFSGIRNTTVLGTPIGIVYGTHRVGGHILNAYNDVIGVNTTGNSSWLRTQVGLCEGEIQYIEPKSIEINNRSISTFPESDIGVLYRLGTKFQTAPDSQLVVSDDATSTVVPVIRTFDLLPNPPGLYLEREYTLESAATSLDVYIGAFVGTYPDQRDEVFHIYWKEASSSEDYINKVGPIPIPRRGWDDKQYVYLDPVKATIVFPTTGMYKIKVVTAKWSTQYYNGAVGPVSYEGLIEYPYYPTDRHPVPSTPTLTLDGYVDKYVIRNSGALNTDVTSSMEYFNRIKNSFSYNLLVTNVDDAEIGPTSDGVVVSTSTPVDALKINLAAPAIYKSEKGELLDTTVEIKVYWKLTEGDSYSEFYPDGITKKHTIVSIRGKTKSESEQTFVVPIRENGAYDVKLIRVTPSNSDNLLVVDNVYVKDVIEEIQEQLIYPHTALLGLSIKATEFISGGLPTITSIIQGTKVQLPQFYNGTRRYMSDAYNGLFKADKEWTDNPVWCLYDLIMNERYGLKNYFKISTSKLGLMKANFFQMAQYCDERITPEGAIITDPLSDDYESARPRFSLNIVIDQSKTAIEWLTIICASMRATLYYTEGVVFIDIDRPKPISQLFNMSNIKEYVETGMSFKQLPNVYEVQFNNKEKDYDQDTLILEDPDYQLDITKEESKKTLQLIGVTGEDQAKSLAKYALRVGQLLTTSVSFKTSTYGLLSTVGDVIGVQHDVPQWGFGGRVVSYDTETRLITVSDDVEISSDVSILYSMQLVCKGKSPEIVAVTPSNTGLCRTFTLDTIPVNTPAKDDLYIVGDITNTVKPFKIVSLKRDKDEVIEVTCVEYLDEIYTDADDITDLPIIVMPNYSSLDTIKRSVKNVFVESTVYVDSTGNLKTGARVYYSKPVQLGWAGVIVYYGINGVYAETPIDKTGVVTIPEITVEGEYQFICISVYTDGTRQSIAEALADADLTPYYTLYITPYIDNAEFIKGVNGLQLVGQGNTTEFAGKDAKFTWRKPAVVDFSLNDLATDSALATATADSWLKEYQITIKNADGSVRHSTKVYDEHYDYKYEQNYVDGAGRPVRTFSITVIAVDRLGRESAPKTLQVTNPVPARIT